MLSFFVVLELHIVHEERIVGFDKVCGRYEQWKHMPNATRRRTTTHIGPKFGLGYIFFFVQLLRGQVYQRIFVHVHKMRLEYTVFGYFDPGNHFDQIVAEVD